MEEKKWFACKAKLVQDVQVYVQAESPDEARELIKREEWDDFDFLDEDDNEGEHVKDYDFDTIVEVPAEEAEGDDDCEDDE
jgi:hypothetical protein